MEQGIDAHASRKSHRQLFNAMSTIWSGFEKQLKNGKYCKAGIQMLAFTDLPMHCGVTDYCDSAYWYHEQSLKVDAKIGLTEAKSVQMSVV